MKTLYSKYQNSVLLKSGTWYLFAVFFQRALNFAAVFLFTRLLSPEAYGTTAIFMPWLTIFASTITLNVYAAAARMKYDFKDEEFKQYISAIAALGTSTSLIALVVLWLAPDPIIDRIFGLEKLYVLLAVFATAAEISVQSTLSVWQVEFKYRQYSLLSLGLTLAKLVVSIVLILLPIGVFQNNPALGRILGMTSISIVAGFWMFARIVAAGKVLYHQGYWRHALSYSVPLIPHVLSGVILAQFDRILIDQYIGRGQAGLYTFAYQMGDVLTMVWTATNAAWVPWFFERVEKKDHALIHTRSTQYLYGFTTISIVAILVGPWLVRLLAPQPYWETINIIPVVIASSFFTLTYSFYSNLEFFEKKTLYISIGTALAAVVNVLLNMWLLPLYGYTIAAWTTLFTYILLFLFHAYIVHYRLRSPSMFPFGRMVILGGVVTLLAAFVSVALLSQGY